MSESRPLKAALLTGPLIAGILALHAWGDGASEQIGDRLDHWRYPERSVGPFRLRVPRRSGAADWASAVLQRFPEDALRDYGAAFDLKRPAAPVQVVLLEAEGVSRRLAGDGPDAPKKNESLYDPGRRAILVRMEASIDQNQVSAALRRGVARLLLQEAGSARWSPWLGEGMVGLLDGSKAADLKAPTDDLPPLDVLLSAREAEFRGLDGAVYARAARLLVAWLAETSPEEFSAYYKASRIEGVARLSRSIERFGDPLREQAAWREWILAQK